MALDVLRDSFVDLCIDPSLNFYDGKCRVLVEGQKLAAGTATNDVVRPVSSVRDVELLYGAGSVLAESLKKIFCQCPNNIQVFAISRADPGGVAAEYTLTITGPATAAGRVELFSMDADYAVDIYVESGDTATTIAAAIVADYPADFPYTVTNVAGVITYVAKNVGTVGNFLDVIYNWRQKPNYPPTGVDAVFAQTVVGTGDIAALDYASVLGSCCYSCYALLGEGVAYQHAWQTYLEAQWSCDTPQCFGHGYTWNSGTLGTILARGTNAAVFSRVAHCTGDDTPPWFKVSAYMALSCCSACENPELSIQGQNYGVLSCLQYPENCDTCFTYDEQTQLREAGFVVTGALANGAGAYTSPYIFNDVTNYLYDDNYRPNATFRDTNSRRLTSATAKAIATELQQYSGLALFTKNTAIKQGVFGTNPRLLLANMRAWAKNQIGVLFSEFENIDEDISIKTDAEVALACQGNPNRLHLFFRYRQPTRIDRITTTLTPKLLENCDR